MPSRRSHLRACVTAGVAGLAGCIDGDGTTGAAGDGETAAGNGETRTPTPGPGEIIWRRSLPGAVESEPVLDGERLFAGSDDGTVTALSRDDGSVQWEYAAGNGVQGRPAVVEDLLLVVSGGVGLGDDHTVHALEAATGDERWTFAPEEWWLDVLGASEGTAFVATTDDAVADAGQTLYALSLADGSTRWSVEVGDNRGGLVTDDRVYVPSMATVRAVDRDGSRAWTYEGGEYQYETLAVAGDTVAFVTADDPREPRVRGFDPATGDERWTFDDWRAHTTRAVGDRLFVGGARVAELDPATGETEWVADQQAALYDAPVEDDTLYTVGESVAAIDTGDGSKRWETSIEAHLASPAGLAAGRLVVRKSASRDDRNRHVLAFDRTSGERQWEFAADSELTRLAVGSDRIYAGEKSDLLALEL